MTLYPEDVERYERPTDEPTEADPLISGPISTSTAVRDALTEMFGDAWQEWSDEATGAAAAVLMWLSSNDRLVGGRSAAPTREQVRSGVLNHLIAHLDSADPVVTPSTVSAVADLATDAVVALLPRPAAPTDRHDDGLVDLLRQLAATQPEHAELLGLAAEEVATLRASRIGLKECIVDLNSELAAAEDALLPRSAAEPPEAERILDEARSLMRTARSLDPTKPASNELLGQVFGDLIELLAPDGVAAEPNKEAGDGR